MPKLPERAHQTQPVLDPLLTYQPVDGNTKVGQFGLQAIEPGDLIGAHDLRLSLPLCGVVTEVVKSVKIERGWPTPKLRDG